MKSQRPKQLRRIRMDKTVKASSQSQKKQAYVTRLFAGRLNRQNYIIGSTLFTIPPIICFFIMTFNSVLTFSTLPHLNFNNPTMMQSIVLANMPTILASPTNTFIAGIGMLFFIISIPYLFSLQVRRLHDLNHSGWYVLLNFVPFVAYLLSIYVAVWPGTTERNNHGAVTVLRTNLMSDILQFR